MKNIFLILLLAPSFRFAFAQEDSVGVKFASTLTEIGTPYGQKLTQKIDREGGRMVAADKQVELVIPPDAVPKKTDISIQPVTNTLSPGSRSAYQLEPSGITFQKPLKIIFHYSSKEEAAISELRSIAWQDDKGQWNALDSTVVDTVSRTVTGSITHFSTWVFFDYFTITPVSARVKISKRLQLQIICTYPGGLSDQLKTNILRQMKFTTYVNGIRGGNAVVGTASSVRNTGSDRFTDYTAPAAVPDNNPVALSVEASNVTFNRKTYSKLKLISNITVFDNAYDIKVTGFNRQNVLTCTVSSIDSSTCTLVLNGNKSRLEDIGNMNVKVNSSGCRCQVTEINEGNNSGSINIEGASKIDITPADPPKRPYRVITVYFVKSVGIMPGWHAPPCGHTNDVVTPPMALPALPFVLAWEDDGKEHLVKGGDDKNGFEIRVRPVKRGDEIN